MQACGSGTYRKLFRDGRRFSPPNRHLESKNRKNRRLRRAFWPSTGSFSKFACLTATCDFCSSENYSRHYSLSNIDLEKQLIDESEVGLPRLTSFRLLALISSASVARPRYPLHHHTSRLAGEWWRALCGHTSAATARFSQTNSQRIVPDYKIRFQHETASRLIAGRSVFLQRRD